MAPVSSRERSPPRICTRSRFAAKRRVRAKWSCTSRARNTPSSLPASPLRNQHPGDEFGVRLDGGGRVGVETGEPATLGCDREDQRRRLRPGCNRGAGAASRRRRRAVAEADEALVDRSAGASRSATDMRSLGALSLLDHQPEQLGVGRGEAHVLADALAGALGRVRRTPAPRGARRDSSAASRRSDRPPRATVRPSSGSGR